jgi:hypothetical protein
MRNQITALEGEKVTLTGELTEFKNKAEAADKEAKKVKAQALVAAAVKLCTIKNEAETIAKWQKRAEDDYEGTKELIETLPVNKVSNRIDVGADANAAAFLENQIAIETAAIKNKLLAVK